MTIQNEQLRREVDVLNTDNIQLRTNNDAMKNEIKQLKTNNDAMKDNNDKQRDEIGQLKVENQQLKVSQWSMITCALHIHYLNHPHINHTIVI